MTQLDPARKAQFLQDFQLAIINLQDESMGDLTRQALDAGLEPQEIIMQGLAPGLEEIGRMYADGDCFIPELVMAGNAMKAAMAILDPIIEASGTGRRAGKILIGTVEGDLHDIGKNLVVSMLRGSGFEIHDLGVNVPTSRFVEQVRAVQPDIVGLSALLLTTRSVMKDVVEALQAAGLRQQVKIMVGGSPVTQSFAEQIGADAFGEDAVEAARLARRLLAQPN